MNFLSCAQIENKGENKEAKKKKKKIHWPNNNNSIECVYERTFAALYVMACRPIRAESEEREIERKYKRRERKREFILRWIRESCKSAFVHVGYERRKLFCSYLISCKGKREEFRKISSSFSSASSYIIYTYVYMCI